MAACQVLPVLSPGRPKCALSHPLALDLRLHYLVLNDADFLHSWILVRTGGDKEMGQEAMIFFLRPMLL